MLCAKRATRFPTSPPHDPAGTQKMEFAQISTRKESKMILVTGATGTVGREVVTQLLAAGQKVRAMTRNPAKAKLDARVDVVRGNFEDPASLDEAVRGVDRIF